MSLILDGTNGLSDIDGSAATPAIRGTDANTGIFFPAADTIAFSEGGVEAARINSSGNLQTIGTISVGNATPSTSGAGITFPATQSASSDANTLDDYEEGTWTPTATNVTITSVVGTYTKIGRKVYITCKAVWPTTANTSAPVIQGLPFTSKTQSGGSGGGSIAYNGSNTDFYVLVDSNSTNIEFYQKLGAQPVNANFSTYEINFSITYLV